MNVGPAGAALIWAHLLIPTHWPVLVAGAGALFYRRKIKNRGKFFFMAWILGYGVQGLVSIPWPLIWMAFFDKQPENQEFAVYYIYMLSVVSVLLTVAAMHIIAARLWQRLYPSQDGSTNLN
jgi:hypothetical protein